MVGRSKQEHYTVEVYRLDWDETMTPKELIDGDVRKVGVHHYRFKDSDNTPKYAHISLDAMIENGALFENINSCPKKMKFEIPLDSD